MRSGTMQARLKPLCLLTVLLSGCGSDIVPIVASPALCKAWFELQTCPQDKFTDQTAKRIIQLNVGREDGYKCTPPPKEEKPDCPAKKSEPRIASVDPKKEPAK